MTADLIALLDRERAEVERLKGVVNRLHQHISKLSGEWQEVVEQRDLATRQLETLRAAVTQVEALRALFGHPPASEVYAAQSELELLRTIRRSQGQAITKFRKERDDAIRDKLEACKERDAASIRNEGLRRQLINVQRDATAWQSEALEHRARFRRASGLMTDCGCQFGVTCCPKCDGKVYANPVEAMKANPRLEMILEESYRNEFKRNIDNQKSHEAPNCPSS